MTHYEALLALLLAQPAFWLERPEGDYPDTTRGERLEMVASELATLPESVAIGLAVQGWRESRWAAYVWKGCVDVPKGASSCDKGRARGYWQLWAGTCPAAYEHFAGTRESLHEEVRCMARLWGGNILRCQERLNGDRIAAAFAGFSGGCSPAGAYYRAEAYNDTLARYLRLKARAAE